MRLHQLTLLIWIISTALLAVGGPNLKHHFATFPLVLFLALHGAFIIYSNSFWRFNRRRYRLIIGIALLVAITGSELWHLGRKIPTDSLMTRDTGLPYAVGSTALQLAEKELLTVYIIEGWGRDAVRYYTRHHPKIQYIGNQHIPNQNVLSDLKGQRRIGLVFEGAHPPKFFEANRPLAACFQQQIHRTEQWIVSMYTSAPQCEL